ncbi:MAG: NAD(+) synthase [Pseudomonadales bacterium]|nr:NAD(+) synthase [Pseudomonadales bacterium]
MKVCLGQINTTPGDFAGNVQAIKQGVDIAAAGRCDLVVFPELTIPGYLSQDLIYHPEYINRNLAAVEEIVAYSAALAGELHIVVGYIERNDAQGKPFFNMAVVISGGKIVGKYKKQLLPFYDVFDELRYFEPGNELLVFPLAGRKVGITICEDLWNDKAADNYSYENNPLRQYRDAGVDTIITLNSSPFVHGKPWQRLKIIAPGTMPGLTVVYVNQRGGQDELVFDGQSFIVSDGDLLHLSSRVDEDSFDIIDLKSALPQIKSVYDPAHRLAILGDSASLFDLLVLCLKDYVEKSGFSQLVLASSGGVDSAVVCKIACEAVGAKNVHAIRMPSVYSSDHSRSDAKQLHKNLGCWDYEVDIDHQPVIDRLNQRYHTYPDDQSNIVTAKTVSGYAAVADENMQARLRDLYIMHFSNAYSAMPLSTGNKTESACGYYTHFDMNFSFAPIKDLYKFQVVEIAKGCSEIPANIWLKPPSAELAEGQTDEASLLAYAVLDPIVCAYVEEYISTFDEFSNWVNDPQTEFSAITSDQQVLVEWLAGQTASKDFYRIISLIGRMEFKRRQTCPGTKVSKVAFGIGRRIPIVEKWS